MVENGKKAQAQVQEAWSNGASKAVETMTLWADANQRVLRELAELTATTAKETVRLYAEMQQTALDAVRDVQSSALRWQASLSDAPRDPMTWYQRTLTETVETAQKAFRIVEGSAQAITKSAERMQTAAEQVGKGIQETLSSAVTKMKDVYAG